MRKIILGSFLLLASSSWAQTNTQVTVGGVNPWPPKGPRCEKFVRCCNKAKLIDNDSDLFCKLRSAQGNLDCDTATNDLAGYLREKGKEPPPECIQVKIQ